MSGKHAWGSYELRQPADRLYSLFVTHQRMCEIEYEPHHMKHKVSTLNWSYGAVVAQGYA